VASSLLALPGCLATRLPEDSSRPTAGVSRIVDDCTALIGRHFARASTVLSFRTDASAPELALAETLRGRGFAVAARPAPDARAVALRLTELDEHTVLMQLRVAKGWGADRLYRRNSSGLSPASSISLRNDDELALIPTEAPPPPGESVPVALEIIPRQPADSRRSPSPRGPDPAGGDAGPLAPPPGSPPAPELPTKSAITATTTTGYPSAPVSPAGTSASAPASIPPPDLSGFNVIGPSPQRIIDLDPQLFDRLGDVADNPFIQLYRPPRPVREVQLVIAATIGGPNPTAIINGRLYNIGNHLDGLAIHGIDDETVWLRRDAFLLRCPIGRDPLTLRFP